MTFLAQALKGLQHGLPFFVGMTKTSALTPAAFTDDLGIYLVIPYLAHIFGLKITSAINLFFSLIIYLSLIPAIIGTFYLFKHIWIKVLISVILIFASHYVLHGHAGVSGVYLVNYPIIIAIVPLFLYFINNHKNKFISMTLFLLLSGVMIGFWQYLRSFSSIPVLIFMCFILIFAHKPKWIMKIIFLITLFIGISMTILAFHSMINHRDSYLKQHVPNYKPVITGHPLWHPVYLGFGFIKNNPYHITFSDTCAANKVYSIDKNASNLGKEYNDILKKEVFKIIRKNPYFFVKTIYQKTLSVLGSKGIFHHQAIYLLAILLCMILCPMRWYIEVAFWLALLFSALPGIAVIPTVAYIFSFSTFIFLYALLSLGFLIDNYDKIQLPFAKK